MEGRGKEGLKNDTGRMKDGRMVGRTDRKIDGRMVERKEARAKWQTDGRTTDG